MHETPARKLTTISTILTPPEQIRVDAAGAGLYIAEHRLEPSQVLADVREGRSSVVLLSVRYCESNQWNDVSRMIREIPRIPRIAILSEETLRTPQVLLHLGREGVRDVVDVRSPSGWEQLRRVLLDDQADWVEALMFSRLENRRMRMTSECWLFLEAVLRYSSKVGSVRRLAGKLGVVPSTLMSRFYRAGLPTPKRYLAVVRLVRAAFLFENSGFSIANVANHLDYSSPQSFGRHVRRVMGMTALQFRRQYTGERMLERFRAELVGPYEQILSWFRPFSGNVIRESEGHSHGGH